MIARDNERTIGTALEVIRRHVQDIVVVDTGSTDRTAEIAASLGARVFHFPWCDDFSAARNESIRHALGQWIFWMDADDSIDDENAHQVQVLAEGNHPETLMGFLMKVRCPASGGNGQTEFTEGDQVKLFRNLPQLRFEGRIHEQILMAIRRAGGTVAWTDLIVVHSGSDQSSEGRSRKQERDLRILQLEYKERPDHPFTLFNLGMTHAEAGNYELAIGFLWQSIGRSGDDDSHLRKTYALLVSSYRQLGRHVTALETCQRGLERFPDDAELRFRQAALLHQFGRLDEAARVYEELLRSQTERHLSSVDRGIQGYRARQNLAAVYADMGELAKAEDQWRAVVTEVPKYLAGWRGLGDVLLRQQKYGDALAIAEQMQTNAALTRDARLLRVETFAAQGDMVGARHGLEAALRENPDDLVLLERYCRQLFEHFPPADAEPVFRSLIERNPADASAHHNLGTILYKLCRHDESTAAYRRSLELRPDSASTYIHLGYALREAGKLDEAAAAWEQCLALEPGHSIAAEELAKISQQP